MTDTTPRRDRFAGVDRCTVDLNDGPRLCPDGRALAAGIVRSERLGLPTAGLRRNLAAHMRGCCVVLSAPAVVARTRGGRR